MVTPSARMARKVDKQSSLARKPRISVHPSAMPPSINERCDTDLSPGTRIGPAKCVAGLTMYRDMKTYSNRHSMDMLANDLPVSSDPTQTFLPGSFRGTCRQRWQYPLRLKRRALGPTLSACARFVLPCQW